RHNDQHLRKPFQHHHLNDSLKVHRFDSHQVDVARLTINLDTDKKIPERVEEPAFLRARFGDCGGGAHDFVWSGVLYGSASSAASMVSSECAGYFGMPGRRGWPRSAIYSRTCLRKHS